MARARIEGVVLKVMLAEEFRTICTHIYLSLSFVCVGRFLQVNACPIHMLIIEFEPPEAVFGALLGLGTGGGGHISLVFKCICWIGPFVCASSLVAVVAAAPTDPPLGELRVSGETFAA